MGKHMGAGQINDLSVLRSAEESFSGNVGLKISQIPLQGLAR